MDNNSLYVGCDVSSDNNFYCFLLGDATEVLTTTLPNSKSGAEKLVKLFLKYLNKYNLNSLTFGVEATSIYHFHLLNFIHFNEKLSDYDVKVYQLNAKIIRNFKNNYPEYSKTDKYDAFVIAERLRFGRLPEQYVPFNNYTPIKSLTRTRFHITKNLQYEMNFFISNLFIKFSEYKKLPFSNTFGNTSVSLFTEFDVEDIINLTMDELVNFLIDKGKNKFANPQEYARKIKKIARDCFRVNQKVQDAINLSLVTSLQTIKTLKSNLKQIDNALKKEMARFNHTLDSVPGIGPVFSAGIIAEIGNIDNFSSESKIAKLAGLVWTHKQSNKRTNEETPMSKEGNKYLRYYLVQAVNLVKNYCPEYRDFYWKKYNEATKHHHKRALVLSARKLVRLIYVLLKEKRIYDQNKYAEHSKKR